MAPLPLPMRMPSGLRVTGTWGGEREREVGEGATEGGKGEDEGGSWKGGRGEGENVWGEGEDTADKGIADQQDGRAWLPSLSLNVAQARSQPWPKRVHASHSLNTHPIRNSHLIHTWFTLDYGTYHSQRSHLSRVHTSLTEHISLPKHPLHKRRLTVASMRMYSLASFFRRRLNVLR